jgi:N-hydroxyarylamine O-acetyltransferase
VTIVVYLEMNPLEKGGENVDVQAYLSRIGIPKTRQPDLAFLRHLQNRHLLSVPFENLDISLGRPIRLSLPAMYDKVVNRKRGGFCYELNALFNWLLRECGFSTSLISARVRKPDGGFNPEFDHLALLVHLDKTYLVDVGFGDSCREPLPLDGTEVEDISGRYRVMAVGETSGQYALQKETKDHWVTEYQFTTIPRELHQFASMCEYHQTSPESTFTQKTVCTIATSTGRITLTREHLTVTKNGYQQKVPIVSEQQFDDLLRQHFHIHL